MGSYVDSQLLGDETVQYSAAVHWAVYLKAIVFAVLGVINLVGKSPGLGVAFLVIAAIAGLAALVRASSTELVITNKRVIAKFGWIRRQTFEQQLSKVEGANLVQGVLGRLFGYASIVVRGTGSGQTPVPFIAEPAKFQHALASRVA